MNDRRITPQEIGNNLVNLRQLTFEVTDDCNLRCRYCGYGEMYSGYDERKAVFAHMAVNTGFFGSLTFMPDGRAYASPAYGEQIGDISDSVYDLITAELERNTAWRLTRNMPKRCKNCLYRYMCPSPSAYEKVMGFDCICTDLKEIGGDTAN